MARRIGRTLCIPADWSHGPAPASGRNGEMRGRAMERVRSFLVAALAGVLLLTMYFLTGAVPILGAVLILAWLYGWPFAL